MSTPAALRPHAASRVVRHLERHPATWLGIVVSAFYGVAALVLYANFRSGVDLAIFDQAVHNLSRFHAPIASMKSPGMNLWGDHFHPILVLAAPLYWVWDDPRTLLVLQAACIGASTSVVAATWLRLRHRRAPGDPTLLARGAWALGLALALTPGVQYGALFDFHEVAMGMPILALALSGLLLGRHRQFLVSSLLLLLVKEDTGVLVCGLALVLFLRGRRRQACALAAVAIGYSLLVVDVVIPALSPTHRWLYGGYVKGVGGALHATWRAFLGDGGLTLTVLTMLASFALLPLRSLLVLAVLPNIASRALSNNTNYWRNYNHYNMLPCVIVAFAAVDVLAGMSSDEPAHAAGASGLDGAPAAATGRGHRLAARLRALRNRLTVARLTSLLLVVAAGLLVLGPVRAQTIRAVVQSRAASARAIIAEVPPGASVAADSYLTPHLTHAHPITQQVRPGGYLDYQAWCDDLNKPLVADWIVLDEHSKANMSTGEWVGDAEEHFAGQGFRIVDRRGDYVLMHR